MKIPPFLLALTLSLPIAGPAGAQQPGPKTPITANDRHAVIESLARQLHDNYVFPEVATAVSKQLADKDRAGGYAGATDAQAFADALAKDLRDFGKDSHFQVAYQPDFRPAAASQKRSAEELASARAELAQRGFGIERVERLAGNVGYLEIRGFGPTEIVGPAFSAAIQLLSGTDALILDLRRNGGGEPDSVAWLMSHFFEAGDPRHLNDIYTRPTGVTQQYWTSSAAPVRYTRPVYVLTSKRTFSGGEECAYDFQTQKRATLVGETTGGGANPGDGFALAKGFAAFIPTGKAINPITKTNWEHVGVTPDIAVPAADAQKTAHLAILRASLAAARDEEERGYLADTIRQVETDTLPKPSYAPPRS